MNRDDDAFWFDESSQTDTNETEPGICPVCEGSGEGLTDGSTCKNCRGLGEI